MGPANEDHTAARLAAIVASSDDAIISKDLNGIIQTWNRGAERIFGFTPEEAIGRSITIIIPTERLQEETEVLRRIARGDSVDHFETVRQHKSGHLIDISLTVSPLFGRRGRVVGASKIARDITEQKRLQREADQASRLKDEFLATLSHELRTPLNAVLGYAMLLQDAALPPDQQAKAAAVIRRNAELLARLVDDLLDTSRVITGKLHLQFGLCDVGKVAREAIEIVRPAAEAKGLRFETSIDAGAPVLADCERLRQVCWNLLANAIKFTPSGGTVTVRVERTGTQMRIVVRDTGIGLTAESIGLIFQRFWQAERAATREHGGLGLGLALSRHVVELHGGTISAKSAGPGTGSEFTVELPVHRSALKGVAGTEAGAGRASVDPGIDSAGGDVADVRV